MAIASAQITLHYVVDIEATYRYYLLQSSTLTTPSKPTTFPPSSEWDDTEPSYTEESTSSLYFVDCTVFCDDTFQYSEVSLSSSYEAAKEAYNKAANAQNDVNELETRVSTTETSIEQNSEQIVLRATSDEVNDIINSTNEKINDLESRLTVTEKSISSLVRRGSTGSILKQDTDGLSYYDISDLEELISNLDGLADKMQVDISDLEKKTEYIRVYTDKNDKPCIELGEGDSDFKVIITNEQIQFIDGEAVPAYVTNKKLMIENAEVRNELRFGNFVWIKRDNENMGLIWKEATE